MSVYKVTGRLGYRGHEPGDIFEATLDPKVEKRGVMRGNITILEETIPAIQPGSYQLPAGWVDSNKEV